MEIKEKNKNPCHNFLLPSLAHLSFNIHRDDALKYCGIFFIFNFLVQIPKQIPKMKKKLPIVWVQVVYTLSWDCGRCERNDWWFCVASTSSPWINAVIFHRTKEMKTALPKQDIHLLPNHLLFFSLFTLDSRIHFSHFFRDEFFFSLKLHNDSFPSEHIFRHFRPIFVFKRV